MPSPPSAGAASTRGGPPEHLRADARRNHERIVTAATELLVEQGMETPRDAIAKRAGVGIGTLYRRFPDRDAIIHAVALRAFATVTGLAEDAVAAAAEDPGALQRFLVGVADQRIGVLMASLVPALTELPTPEVVAEAFEEMLAAVDALVAHSHAVGDLRAEVTSEDVMLLLAFLTRPLEGLPLDYSAALVPRLLHLLTEGIAPSAQTTPPPAAPPPLDLDIHRRSLRRDTG